MLVVRKRLQKCPTTFATKGRTFRSWRQTRHLGVAFLSPTVVSDCSLLFIRTATLGWLDLRLSSFPLGHNRCSRIWLDALFVRSFSTSARLFFFCNFNQCWSHASTATDFI